MGIRFLCPNGHKLHVKSFLSGKRAICPVCGARVIVPEESTRSASPTPEPGGTTTEPSLEISKDLLAELRSDASSSSPAKGQPVAEVRPVATKQPDPIAEAPGAVWYVRPASGGQFGPASGEIMRSWIDEGRVGASALIWRDGWSEWRSAAATFPQLSSLLVAPSPLPQAMLTGETASSSDLPRGQVAEMLPPSPPPSNSSSSVPPLSELTRKRRRKKDVSLMTSAVLVVVTVILIVVLALVFRAQSNPGDTETTPAASAEPGA